MKRQAPAMEQTFPEGTSYRGESNPLGRVGLSMAWPPDPKKAPSRRTERTAEGGYRLYVKDSPANNSASGFGGLPATMRSAASISPGGDNRDGRTKATAFGGEVGSIASCLLTVGGWSEGRLLHVTPANHIFRLFFYFTIKEADSLSPIPLAIFQF